jgi:hypothetical protein
MALSAKERKQKQLEREQKALRTSKERTYPYLSTPFYKHLENNDNWSSVTLCFDLMGIEPPQLLDDRGPAEFADDACFSTDEDRDEAFQSSEKSIGRAEVMVDLLFDAGMELALIINNFKKAELQRRRAELEEVDMSNPDKRNEALETAANTAKLLEELQKNVRRTIPQWRVKTL